MSKINCDFCNSELIKAQAYISEALEDLIPKVDYEREKNGKY